MLNLPHIAARVFGTPLMIGRAKLEVILGVLGPRFAGGLAESPPPDADTPPLVAVTNDGIAIIPIIGTLVSRTGFVDAASGLLSYGEIGEAIVGALADPAVQGLIIDMDSPGGEVGGLFDLVDRIPTLRGDSRKPLWAVANEAALSAAYAIASAADRIYVRRRYKRQAASRSCSAVSRTVAASPHAMTDARGSSSLPSHSTPPSCSGSETQ